MISRTSSESEPEREVRKHCNSERETFRKNLYGRSQGREEPYRFRFLTVRILSAAEEGVTSMTKEEEKFIRGTTLYVKGISKTFGSNKALDHIDLVIMPGQIMGLLGKNGCGKSTLIKILSGYHQPDKGGEVYVNGKQVRLPIHPGEFAEYGMSFVHQDLGLVDTLTVAENWMLSDIATTNKAKIDYKMYYRDIRETFHQYGLNIDPKAQVSALSPVQKAMLAILRAVVNLHDAVKEGRGLLVLDEPTVFLPRTEVNILFRLVRSIASEGISVMFVSHDLDEVMALTDAFTVLRDGRNVGSGTTALTDKNSVIEMILGESLNEYHTELKDEEALEEQEPVLEAADLTGNVIHSVNFKAYPGEVLGITGLAGSGFEELPYLLFGDVEGESGKLKFLGDEFDLKHFSPGEAVKKKMALIPADRKNLGGVTDLRIDENIMMQSMYHYRPRRLDHKGMRKRAMELVSEYTVHPADIKLDFGMLSGGNQQKVLLAKWIQEKPELLILHEPTQGIDIGARQAIYRLIEKTVKETGMAVICNSSDYEQLEQICDRVLILVNGEITEELTGSEITKERITQFCYGTAEATGELL